MGDLKIVDGKPVAPKLATLEVNLIGVFYSRLISLPTRPCTDVYMTVTSRPPRDALCEAEPHS